MNDRNPAARLDEGADANRVADRVAARIERLISDSVLKPAEGGDASAILIPFNEARRERLDLPVAFERRELELILRLYGRMVAANEWRDYAIDHLSDRAVFSVFRRTSEVPLFQIVKDPKLARKQGAYSVVAAGGRILKRGHELARVLGVFDRSLKLVEA